MNGPDHYRAAETLLTQVKDMTSSGKWNPALVGAILDAAKVHAALAGVAAQVKNHAAWTDSKGEA